MRVIGAITVLLISVFVTQLLTADEIHISFKIDGQEVFKYDKEEHSNGKKKRK